MRVLFAGTPEFAALALRAVLAAGHEVPLVLTQPDRPAGRGLKPQASAVKQVALAHGLALAQPRSLRLDGKYPDDAAQARSAMQQAAADVAVVAAYGLLLPPWVLALPRLGCLNIHASLLPRWRGAAPIQRALEAGDAESGITLMQMDAGLDTGPMLLRQALPIAAHDTASSLHDRLAQMGAQLVLEALQQAEAGRLQPQPQPQPEAGVSYAHKIDKAEALIDWRHDAAQIARRVRAFDPAPGASTLLGGATLKVWGAHALPAAPMGTQAAAPGTVLAADASGVQVQTGAGVLVLTELQRAGGKRLAVAPFLAGHALAVGTVLGGAG
jgi:methionyl-tRNA formyltransferase